MKYLLLVMALVADANGLARSKPKGVVSSSQRSQEKSWHDDGQIHKAQCRRSVGGMGLEPWRCTRACARYTKTVW